MNLLPVKLKKNTKMASEAIANFVSLVGAGANRNAFIKTQDENSETHKVELIPNYAPDDSEQTNQKVTIQAMSFQDDVSVQEAKNIAQAMNFNLDNVVTEYNDTIKQSVIYEKDKDNLKEFLQSNTLKNGNLVKLKQSIPIENNETVDILFVLEVEQNENNDSIQQQSIKQEATQNIKQFMSYVLDELEHYGYEVKDVISSLNNVENFENVPNVLENVYQLLGNPTDTVDNSYSYHSVLGFEELNNLLKYTVSFVLRNGTKEQAVDVINKAFEYREKLNEASKTLNNSTTIEQHDDINTQKETDVQGENDMSTNESKEKQLDENQENEEVKQDSQEVNQESNEPTEQKEKDSEEQTKKDKKKYSEAEMQEHFIEMMGAMKTSIDSMNEALKRFNVTEKQEEQTNDISDEEVNQESTQQNDSSSSNSKQNTEESKKENQKQSVDLNVVVTDSQQEEKEFLISRRQQRQNLRRSQGRDIKSVSQNTDGTYNPKKRAEYLKRIGGV